MADWLCSATEISLRKTASTTKMSATKYLIAYLFSCPGREPGKASGDILPGPTGSLLLLIGELKGPRLSPSSLAFTHLAGMSTAPFCGHSGTAELIFLEAFFFFFFSSLH